MLTFPVLLLTQCHPSTFPSKDKRVYLYLPLRCTSVHVIIHQHSFVTTPARVSILRQQGAPVCVHGKLIFKMNFALAMTLSELIAFFNVSMCLTLLLTPLSGHIIQVINLADLIKIIVSIKQNALQCSCLAMHYAPLQGILYMLRTEV